MKIDVITYKDELQQDLKSMLRDYLNLVAEEVKHDPWRFEVNIAEALDFTFQNLSDFTPPKGKIFIAQNSNQTVGTASIKKIRPDTAEIKRMYVKPEYQGNGIGNLLLENVIEEAKRMDAREIFLDSPPPFKPAHKLYEKYGFETFQEYPEVAIPAELKIEWAYMKKIL